MYPTEDHIYNGIHVKEQIDALTKDVPVYADTVFINGRQSTLNYLKSIWDVNKTIFTRKYDLLHIHFGLSGLFSLFNPFIKVPIVLTLHGSDIRPSGYRVMYLISKLVAFRVDKIIIVNDLMREKLNLNSKKLVTIPCGIDTNFFFPHGHLNTPGFVVGFPGSPLRVVKNFALFEQILELCREKGIQAHVVEFHNLTRLQVREKLKTLDCLLMTSVSEGSPQIIKEAMAIGVPVISSNVGDVKFLLSDVTNCTVIDSFDPNDYVEPLVKLAKMEVSERRSNGFERLRLLQLDHKSTSQKIFQVYSEIVEND